MDIDTSIVNVSKIPESKSKGTPPMLTTVTDDSLTTKLKPSERRRQIKCNIKNVDEICSLSDSTGPAEAKPKPKKKGRKRRANGKASDQKHENIDLAQRRDVVNKTILRALRRFYTQKLKENSKTDPCMDDLSPKPFLESVKDLCSVIFGAEHRSIKELSYYMAYIISPKDISQ